MTKETAYHEEGHAVIARALGIEVHLATIRPDEFYDGRVAHKAGWPDRDYETLEDSEEQWQRAMETAEDRAKLALAGPLAEIKYRPVLNGEYLFADGDLSDVATYLKIAGGFTFEVLVPGRPLEQNHGTTSQLWEALQRDTAALVESYWPSIERVAEALLIYVELRQEQIDALIY